MTHDRDLLYAVFTQHLGYATGPQVLSWGNEWVERRERGVTMRQILREKGALQEEQARLVDALVLEALRVTDGDAKAAFDTLPRTLRDSLSGMSGTLTGDPGRAIPDDEEITAKSSVTDSLSSGKNVAVEAAGRYRFDTGRLGTTEELGKGGVGRVVVARDAFLGREVAVKELLREVSQDASTDTLTSSVLEARFLREARLTGQLEHPAVVPVYELGRRKDGTLYYTMQRVRGRTLAQAISDAGSFEARLALLPDFVTVCRAVASAHHQDIIHRDLKPQNVMLGAFGATFVMDWGLARVLGKKDPHQRPVELAPDITGERDSGAVGTPSYMSPEQARADNDEVDERSDVWGLGAILFELLTGRAPYLGLSPWDVLANVRSEPVTRVLDVEPKVPPELAAICEQALSRNRGRRTATATELADQVAAFLDGGRVSVYRYRFAEIVRRIYKKNRMVALVSLALLAGGLASGSVFAWRVKAERDEARAFARLVLEDVAEKLEDTPESSELVGQLMSSSLEVLRRSTDLDRGPKDDRLRLARAWHRVGVLAWKQGQLEQAQSVLALAVDAERRLLAQDPKDAVARTLSLQSRMASADVLQDQGHPDDAIASYLVLLPEARAAVEESPNDPERLYTLAATQSRLGFAYNNGSRYKEALPFFLDAAESGERLEALAPSNAKYVASLASDMSVLGLVQLALDRTAEAQKSLNRAIAVAGEALKLDPSNANRLNRALVVHNLGRLQFYKGDTAAWQQLERQVREEIETVLAIEPRNVTGQWTSAEASLFLDEPGPAWERARQLEGQPEFQGMVAIAAFAAGHDELVHKHLGNPAGAFGNETWFMREVVAMLKGDEARETEAAQALATSGDLYLLAPYAVRQRLASSDGPRERRVKALCDVLLARPATHAGISAALTSLAKPGAPK